MKRKFLMKVTVLALLVVGIQTVLAQWVPMHGPGGGTITTFHVSGTNIFAGTDRGIYLSIDNGLSWVLAGKGLETKSIYSITECGGNLLVNTYDGIYRSTDHGTTWTLIHTSLRGKLEVIGNTIVAGTENGIFLSKDNGVSWDAVLSDSLTLSVDYLAVSGGNIIAADDEDIVCSSDSGVTWTSTRFYREGYYGVITTLNVGGNKIFLGFSSRLFVSNDGGIGWEEFNAHDEGMTVKDVTINGDSVCAINETGVYLSPVDGGFWRKVSGADTINEQSINCLSISGTTILAGTRDKGIYRSVDNGRSWVSANSGLRNIRIDAIAVSGNNIFAKSMINSNDRMFLSTDGGINWSDVTIEDYYNTDCLAVIGNTCFAAVSGISLLSNGSNSSGLYCYDVNERKWDKSGLTNAVLNLAVCGNTILAGTADDALFLSTDTEKNWTEIKPDSLPDRFKNLEVAGSLIIATKGLSSNTIANRDTLLISNDFGVNWVVSDWFEFAAYAPSAIKMIGNTFFAQYTSKLYRSNDSGRSWDVININIPLINSLVVSENTLIASCDTSGLFLSTDLGNTWNPVDIDLPEASPVFRMTINKGRLYAVNSNNNWWRRPLSDFTIAVRKREHAVTAQNDFKIVLSGASRSNISILLSLSHREHVAVSVYNMSGSFVRTLTNRYFREGSHMLSLDTRVMAAGSYLVKMKTRTKCSAGIFAHVR